MARNPHRKLSAQSVGIVRADNWEDLLRQNFVELSKIRPKYIIDALYQACILSDCDKEEIMAKVTTRQQASYLLELLPAKGYQNFVKFLNILEMEYPHIYETVTTVTAKERPAGYKRTDRYSFLLEQMPLMMGNLSEEIKNKKHLQGDLDQLQKTLDIIQKEKAELENDLDECKGQLEDLPQLRKDVDTFSRENQELTRQKADNAQRCLQYIAEKENVEKRCRQLQTQNGELERQVQKLRWERDQEKRRTRKLAEKLDQQNSVDIPLPVPDEVVPPVSDPEKDILQDQLRDAQEQNEEYGQQLADTRMELQRLEVEIEQLKRGKKKMTEILKNVEENKENLKSRCDENWEQIARLRIEKDLVIEQRESLQDMYTQVSTERDRLSSQKRRLEKQYDETKQQLDKVKQEMRSSLSTSIAEQMSSSIHQWINQLDQPSLLLAGGRTSSSGVSGSDEIQSPASPYPYELAHPFTEPNPGCTLPNFFSREPLINQRERQGVLLRSGTVDPQVDKCDMREAEYLLDHQQAVSKAIDRACKQFPNDRHVLRHAGRRVAEDEDIPRCQSIQDGNVYDSAEPMCNSVSVSPPVQLTDAAGLCGSHFYVRCNHDSRSPTEEEIPYKEGEIYKVTDDNYQKNGGWFAHSVNQNTGMTGGQTSPGVATEGVLRVNQNTGMTGGQTSPGVTKEGVLRKGEISRSHRPELPPRSSHLKLVNQSSAPSTSLHGRTPYRGRPAIKVSRSEEKESVPFSVVVPERVQCKRPVMMLGPRDVLKSLVAMLEKQEKFHSWFGESIVDSQEKLNFLKTADKHIILPCGTSSTLSNLVAAKVFPICLLIELSDSDPHNKHLTTLLGQLEDMEISKDPISKVIAEIRSAGLTYEKFIISRTYTPTTDDLQQKLVTRLLQMQSHMVWVPTAKAPVISP